jgi:predicted secreted protein
MGGVTLAQPVVGMASTPNGYYLVARDGGVFAFGPGAPFFGSMGGVTLSAPIVGIAVAPGGNGYYLVGADGGVFAFGPGAVYRGSMGGVALSKPVVGMATTAAGYYLVASDGGVFAFGPPFYGSTGGVSLARPVVGMSALSNGYYLVASDGGVFAYGPGAAFYGSMGGTRLVQPVVGMTAVPGSAAASNGTITLTMTSARSSLPADGVVTTTLTAEATNQAGHPVSGDTFTVSTSPSPAGACGPVSPTTATQGPNGPSSFTYTASTTPGTCTITVQESEDSLSTSLSISQTPVIVLTSANNGGQVAMHVGDTVEIQLSACASCGYQWGFVAPAPSSSVLSYQGETTQGGGGAPGGNVTDVFTFEAVGTGNTPVHLGYFPPGSQTPSQNWSATFTVS